MSQTMRHIVMAVVVLLAAVPAAWGGNVTFKAKLDSATAVITICINVFDILFVSFKSLNFKP